MRDQEIIGLWEAYQQVHAQPEEVEQLDEQMVAPNQPNPHPALMKIPYIKDETPEQKQNRLEREVRRSEYLGAKSTDKKSTQVAHFDLFDVIKGHLLDEGYADNEDAALAIMANMSEEWKQSIVEGVRPGDVETPLNMATYNRRRRSLAGSEERDDARSRGHEEPSTGRTYSTGEARSRRRGIHTPAGKPNRDAARDAAGGETGHGGPLRPNKVRKARAMGELGEK